MTGKPDCPDILFPPPVISIAAPLLAVLLEFTAPIHIMPPAGTPWSLAIGIVILLIAGTLAVSAVRAFKAAETNIRPHQPALNIVKTGPYRFTRNPMYLGMVLFKTGIAFTFSLDWAILLAPLVWIALHFGVVLREEAYLTAKFGQTYTDFIQQTRRWF